MRGALNYVRPITNVCSLIAELDGRLLRVQVKTSTYLRKGRWEVRVATSGGNQSWTGVVKRMSASRCDYLFVLVGDGRRWFVPSARLGGGNVVLLGGPKYAEFEVARGRPLAHATDAPARSTIALA